MNYLFAAVTTSLLPKNNEIIDAPEVILLFIVTSRFTMWYNFEFYIVFQDTKGEPTITFIFENTSEKILAVESHGKITDVEYNECLKKCRRSSEIIFKFYKDMISKYALKM